MISMIKIVAVTNGRLRREVQIDINTINYLY